MEQVTQNGERTRVRWKNRRKMAWTSLISMIVFVLLVMFVVPESRLEMITEMLSWYFLAGVSVIGAYMGVTAWADVKKR